jgi:hypothetical protein
MKQNHPMTLRPLCLFVFLLLAAGTLHAQAGKERTTPLYGLKSNVAYDAAGSFNLGAEFRLSPRLTLDVPVVWNPLEFSDNRKWKHLLFQPELRLWTCEAFNGHFFGVHAHYAGYNVGGVGSRYMKEYRFEGWLAGVGVSYGYQWLVSPRWSIEASLGLGYAYMDYDRYLCRKCGAFQSKDKMNYFGPTKAAISLIYIIK